MNSVIGPFTRSTISECRKSAIKQQEKINCRKHAIEVQKSKDIASFLKLDFVQLFTTAFASISAHYLDISPHAKSFFLHVNCISSAFRICNFLVNCFYDIICTTFDFLSYLFYPLA